ncbi:MAG TPA: GNAT family N-acetyltransferase [Propionibacteriaceae bacterium]|nr:GNAT family N-acetyltransferase [Propionibacteriaceae bacterium]
MSKVHLRKAGLMAGRSSDPLATALPGERWVLRCRLPDGSATDVIGWIDIVDPTSVRLVNVDAAQVIERYMIIAARRAPAAAGGLDPGRISAHALQRHALPGWLAWHSSLGEWTLRAGGGFTRRANSCHAVGDPGVPIEQAAGQIISFAVSHDIDPLAQVIDGSAEESALRRLGWRSIDQPTAVLVSRLADFLADRPAAHPVTISEVLEPDWEQMYQQSRPNSADPAIVGMILEGNRPRAFAAVANQKLDDHSKLVAIARGHRHQDWLGLASIWTRPDHRRRGMATSMMVALGHWAARQRARYAYVQVAKVSEGPIAAYTKLGFVHHHAYRYLAPT